jgi:hypothetical protein
VIVTNTSASYLHAPHAGAKHLLSHDMSKTGHGATTYSRTSNRRSFSAPPPRAPPPNVALPSIIEFPTSLPVARGPPASLRIQIHDAPSSQDMHDHHVARASQPTPQPLTPVSPLWTGLASPVPSRYRLTIIDDVASDFSWEAQSMISGQRTPSAVTHLKEPSGFPIAEFSSAGAPATFEVHADRPVAPHTTPAASTNTMQEHLANALSSIYEQRAHGGQGQRGKTKPLNQAELPCAPEPSVLAMRNGPPSPTTSVFSSLEDDLLPDFDLGNLNRMSAYAMRPPSLILPLVLEVVPKLDADWRPSLVQRATSDKPEVRTERLELEEHGTDGMADPVIPICELGASPRKSQSLSELRHRATVSPVVRPHLHSFNSSMAPPLPSTTLRGVFINNNSPDAPPPDSTVRAIAAQPRPALPVANASAPRVRDSWKHLYELATADGETDFTAGLFEDSFGSPTSRPGHSQFENAGWARDYAGALRDGAVMPVDVLPVRLSSLRSRNDSHGTVFSSLSDAERALHRSVSSGSRSSMMRPCTPGSYTSSASRDSWFDARDKDPAVPRRLVESRLAGRAGMLPPTAIAPSRRLLRHALDDHASPGASRRSSLSHRGPPSVRSDASGSVNGEPLAELRHKMSGLLRPTPDLTLSHPSGGGTDSVGHPSAFGSSPDTHFSPIVWRKGSAAVVVEEPYVALAQPSGMTLSLGWKRGRKAVAADEGRSATIKGKPTEELMSFMPETVKKPGKKKLFGKGLGW